MLWRRDVPARRFAVVSLINVRQLKAKGRDILALSTIAQKPYVRLHNVLSIVAHMLHINKRQTPSMSAAVPVQTPLHFVSLALSYRNTREVHLHEPLQSGELHCLEPFS